MIPSLKTQSLNNVPLFKEYYDQVDSFEVEHNKALTFEAQVKRMLSHNFNDASRMNELKFALEMCEQGFCDKALLKEFTKPKLLNDHFAFYVAYERLTDSVVDNIKYYYNQCRDSVLNRKQEVEDDYHVCLNPQDQLMGHGLMVSLTDLYSHRYIDTTGLSEDWKVFLVEFIERFSGQSKGFLTSADILSMHFEPMQEMLESVTSSNEALVIIPEKLNEMEDLTESASSQDLSKQDIIKIAQECCVNGELLDVETLMEWTGSDLADVARSMREYLSLQTTLQTQHIKSDQSQKLRKLKTLNSFYNHIPTVTNDRERKIKSYLIRIKSSLLKCKSVEMETDEVNLYCHDLIIFHHTENPDELHEGIDLYCNGQLESGIEPFDFTSEAKVVRDYIYSLGVSFGFLFQLEKLTNTKMPRYLM